MVKLILLLIPNFVESLFNFRFKIWIIKLALLLALLIDKMVMFMYYKANMLVFSYYLLTTKIFSALLATKLFIFAKFFMFAN